MSIRFGWAGVLAVVSLSAALPAAQAAPGISIACSAWNVLMSGPRRAVLQLVFDRQAESVDLACRPGDTAFYFELNRDDCAAVQGLLRRYWSWQAQPRTGGRPLWLGGLDLQGGFELAGTPQRGGERSSVVFWGLPTRSGHACLSLQFESIQSGDSPSLATPDSLVLDALGVRRLFWGMDPARLDEAFSHHRKKKPKPEDADPDADAAP
jgi:hypothetical protein